MSDGDSVATGLKDLSRETVKQIKSVPKSIVLGAKGQMLNKDTEEEEERKKKEMAQTHARIKEIEAEMAAIRAQNEQKRGPEVLSEKEKLEAVQAPKQKRMDEASRQAVGRAEQGRNFKG